MAFSLIYHGNLYRLLLPAFVRCISFQEPGQGHYAHFTSPLPAALLHAYLYRSADRPITFGYLVLIGYRAGLFNTEF